MRKALIILSILLIVSSARAEEGPVSITILMDNSATLLNVADAQEVQRLLLHKLTQLRKKRATKNALVNIVSLNDPRNLFTGTPKRLLRNGASVLPLLGTVRNGCMDLAGALDQMRTNVEMQNPSRVEVFIVSSMIATGAPCEGMTISLPHPMPQDLDLGFLVERKAKVRVYWVHHLQMRPAFDAFRNAGLEDVRLYDEAGSRSALEEGLQ